MIFIQKLTSSVVVVVLIVVDKASMIFDVVSWSAEFSLSTSLGGVSTSKSGLAYRTQSIIMDLY